MNTQNHNDSSALTGFIFLLKESYKALRLNYQAYLIFSVILIGLRFLVQIGMSNKFAIPLSIVFTAVDFYLVVCAIYLSLKSLKGQKVEIKDFFLPIQPTLRPIWTIVLKSFLILIIMLIAFAIGVALFFIKPILATIFGLLCFIGIAYVAIRLSFATYYVCRDNLKTIESFARSIEATADYVWPIFLNNFFLMVSVLICLIPFFVISTVIRSSILTAILFGIYGLVISPFVIIFTTKLFKLYTATSLHNDHNESPTSPEVLVVPESLVNEDPIEPVVLSDNTNNI